MPGHEAHQKRIRERCAPLLSAYPLPYGFTTGITHSDADAGEVGGGQGPQVG